ncbi:MAG: hypothetical protein ACOH2A_00970 [Sphingobacteriaceae bacterium]
MMDINTLDNLVGQQPKDWLVHHGPKKLLVDNFHWHEPKKGIVASYTPNALDVEDHFGVFRGVDQIEAFAQATTGACGVFSQCLKSGNSPMELKAKFIPRFISVGQVYFYNYLEKGDTFISIGYITFYKFRQMVCDGRIYKVPGGMDLDDYFKDFNETRLLKYDLRDDFVLVAEFHDITGVAVKKELIKTQIAQ